MAANHNTPRRWLVLSRGNLIVYAVIFIVSVLSTFLLTHDRNIVALLITSLFFFVPGLLMYGTLRATRTHFVDFGKNRKWAELATIIILLLCCAFYLLLIVLVARTLMR